jgi:hypothetical protein
LQLNQKIGVLGNVSHFVALITVVIAGATVLSDTRVTDHQVGATDTSHNSREEGKDAAAVKLPQKHYINRLVGNLLVKFVNRPWVSDP